MWSVSEFGEFIPIWGLPALWVAVIVLLSDFGGVMLVRGFIERELYLGRWWSFRIGDTIGLPILAGFGAVVIDHDLDGFPSEIWVHLFFVVLGILGAVFINAQNLLTGQYTWEEVKKPSEVYHTAILAVMVYLIGTLMVAILFDGTPLWATIAAFTGFAIWLICVIYDSIVVAPKGKGRISPNEIVLKL